MNHMGMDELVAGVVPVPAPPLRACRDDIWRHKKTSGLYRVISRATIEATMEPAVVYRSLLDGMTWVRPEAEFLDGRFEQVEVIAAPKHESP